MLTHSLSFLLYYVQCLPPYVVGMMQVRTKEVDAAQAQQHVIVVGGGVKGLFCARLLNKQGLKVTLLERGARVGGKIATVRSDCKATHAELGAMRILDSQPSVLTLIRDLGLRTAPFIEDNPNCPFLLASSVRGTARDLTLSTFVEAGVISQTDASDSGLDPGTVFAHILRAAFAAPEGEELGGESEIETGRRGDGETVAHYLTKKAPKRVAATRKCALAVLDLRNGRGGMHHVVKVREFAQILKLHSGAPLHLPGGFDRLTAALSSELPAGTVRLGCEVVRLAHTASAVAVTFREGGCLDRLVADAVLLACPALQKITFDPPLPAPHTSAVQQLLGSQPAVKCALLFSDRFWERPEHGAVAGGTSWIGPSAINQVYFPPPLGEEGGSTNGSAKGYLMLYIRGDPMVRWMQSADRVRQGLGWIKQLFPEARVHELFEAHHEQVWDEPGAGAYYLSGAPAVMQALSPVGRVVFSPVPRGWLDDAINDGAGAVQLVLKGLDAMRGEAA